MAKTNGGGSLQSAIHSQAAKDDCLALNPFNIYNVSDLLANDPGSAHGVTFAAGSGVTLNSDGTFNLAWGVTSFDYTEQMANGTLSTAHVNLAGRVGDELVQNWSFEEKPEGATVYAGTIAPDGSVQGGFTSSPELPGWTNNNLAVSLEDVSVQYGGFATNITDGTDNHWLDTQGSPGGIDISQALKMTAGTAHMEFVVAKEPPVTVPGGTVFAQDPNEELAFMLDGKQVGSPLTVDDFAAAGKFQAFDFNVNVATAGLHTLEIKSLGATAYVGYAIDSVSVHQMVAAACGSEATG